jgi:hypothetical protein
MCALTIFQHLPAATVLQGIIPIRRIMEIMKIGSKRNQAAPRS